MNTKKFIQILAVSATALITACEEQLTSFEGETPITVSTLVSEKTRAGYDNANLPSTFVMDIEQGSENYNYSLVTMTRGNGNTYNAPANMLLLWKGTDHSTANIKAMTIPYGLSAIDANNAMTVKVHTNQTTDANVKASDLLGAKSGDGISISGDNINIEFRHLMSKLYVTYEFATGTNATVNSITLENICVQGGYSYASMDYHNDNNSLDYDNITMFHNRNSRAAEAIFYPHSPGSNLRLKVNITIQGRTTDLSCPIVLTSGKPFEGRKLYTMNIRINGTSIDNANITTVKDWIDSGSMTNKKILWVGTSLCDDVDGFAKSYPKIIEEATGWTIINNGKASSYVLFGMNGWTTADWLEPNTINPYLLPQAWSLSATKTEIESKYTTILTKLAWDKYPEDIQGYWWNEYDANEEIRNQYLAAIPGLIADFQAYSYESLILPFIDPKQTNDPCNVIVIDHGFNDRNYIALEALYKAHDGLAGKDWLNSLKTRNDYKLADWYKQYAKATSTEVVEYAYDEQGKRVNFYGWGLGDKDKASYITAMNFLIDECKRVNPSIQIIIGNYFATGHPYLGDPLVKDEIGQFHYIGDCLVQTNEAIARMNGLEIVNVYEDTGLNKEHDANGELFELLCPDHVHPGSDPVGRLNRIIANIYLEKFREIFGK